MACYSGLTRVIRHPRDPCRSERSPSKVHPSRVSRCTCSRTCTYAYAGCTPPHSSAGCTPPHSSLTAHSPHAGLARGSSRQGPGPRGAIWRETSAVCRSDETCERRAERCSTNYVVPLKRWQAFSCRATLPERVLCDFSCPPLTRLARFHWADLLVRRAL